MRLESLRGRLHGLPDIRLSRLLGFSPIVVYLIVRRLAGTQAGIGAGFAFWLLFFALNRERGAITALAALGLALAAFSAAAGLLFNNDTLYLVREPVGDFVTVAVLAGSALARKPIVGAVAKEIAPRFTAPLDPRCGWFYALTLLWAGQNLAAGLMRVMLLQTESAEGYVVQGQLFSTSLTIALLLFSIAVAWRLRARALRPEVAAVAS